MAPSIGRTLGRGAGWGALLGFVAGFPLFGVVGLFVSGDPAMLLLVPLVGWYTGVIGAAYGLVAGSLVAAATLPFRANPETVRRLRAVWALVGVVVIAAISAIAFRPSLEPGPNETNEHVRERVLLFYVAPCLLAAGAGFALTPRLLAGSSQEAHRNAGET